MDKRLKILQFVRSSDRYGASVSIKNLCRELRSRGHEIVLLTHKGHSLGADMQDFRTIEVEAASKFSVPGMLRIRSVFKQEKPDLIHTHLSVATLSGSVAARLAGIPVIATVHGMNSRWTYGFADRLITVSEAAKQHLVRQGIRGSKISVAYNGIDMPTLPTVEEKQAAKESLGIDPQSIVLGSTSRADYGKGIHNVLDALAMVRRRFPKLHYVFAGEGDHLEALKTQAKKLSLCGQVEFLGFRRDVFNVLSAIDVFVLPSLKEAMGISIVEAMAMGLPVVSTRVGGIPEVVDESSGVLVGPNHAPDLAQALVTVLTDSEKRNLMGADARKQAERRFSISASADMVEEAYGSLLDSGARSGPESRS